MTLHHKEFPALEHFLSTYLHQDWREVDSSTEEAFEHFVRAEPDWAPRIASELTALIRSGEDDAALLNVIREAGSFYLPSVDGLQARTWLAVLLQLSPRPAEEIASSHLTQSGLPRHTH